VNTITKTKQDFQSELGLDLYLNNLLAEIPEAIETEIPVDVVVSSVVEVLSTELAIIPSSVKIKETAVSKAATQVSTAVKSAKPLSIMPDWSQKEFQALFFKVDKQVLAVPLTELSRTLNFNREPTKIPHQPGWFIGLLEDHGKRIGILDTGQLIFGKIIGSRRNLTEQPFTSILISGDGKWGFACDEILTISKIFPDKVRWRTLRKDRPWLIGTVIENLTAVIDPALMLPGKKLN
jgi:purine-binding chemotaxis protein CheW